MLDISNEWNIQHISLKPAIIWVGHGSKRSNSSGKREDLFKPTITNSVLKRCYLVGGWPTPLKNISQLGLLFPIYGKMFQTTNQLSVCFFGTSISRGDAGSTPVNSPGFGKPRAWKPGAIPLDNWEYMRKLTFSNGWSPSCATVHRAWSKSSGQEDTGRASHKLVCDQNTIYNI